LDFTVEEINAFYSAWIHSTEQKIHTIYFILFCKF